MDKKCVGIVGNDTVAEAIALHYAKNGYEALLLVLDEEGNPVGSENLKKVIRIKNIKLDLLEVPIARRPITWVSSFEELSRADLMVEALHDNLAVKKHVLPRIESVAGAETPILSNGRMFMPSELVDVIEDPSKFIVSYMYDVEFTGTNVELVTHPKLSEKALERIKSLVSAANQNYGVIKEKVGFVHNRLGLLSILAIMKYFDEKLLSLENLAKYIIVTWASPKVQMNMTLGREIKFELVESIELMKELGRQLGNDRFRIPDYFKYDNVTFENIFDILAKDSCEDYSIPESEFPDTESPVEYKSIFIRGAHPIYNNIILPLVKSGATLCFDEEESKEYFGKCKTQSSSFYDKLIKQAVFLDPTQSERMDLIIDFSIEYQDEKILACKSLQERFGTTTPILLNTPILKIQDVARNCHNPSMIFGMFTIKSYLQNTELVIHPLMDKKTYVAIRRFIKKIASDYVETKDTYARLLAYEIIAKLLESVRIVEEGIATIADVESIGVDGPVFKYMDLLEIKNIVKICDYLEPIYGGCFKVPGTLTKMMANDEVFYKS